MKNIKLVAVIILFFCMLALYACKEEPKVIYKKPFIVISKMPWRLGSDTLPCVHWRYVYSDVNGNERFFVDKEGRYSVGDTLK